MERLKKYLKKFFVMINKYLGGGQVLDIMKDTTVMRGGGIELMGVLPVPTRENPEEPYCLAVSKQESSYSTNDRPGCYQKMLC